MIRLRHDIKCMAAAVYSNNKQLLFCIITELWQENKPKPESKWQEVDGKPCMKIIKNHKSAELLVKVLCDIILSAIAKVQIPMTVI